MPILAIKEIARLLKEYEKDPFYKVWLALENWLSDLESILCWAILLTMWGIALTILLS